MKRVLAILLAMIIGLSAVLSGCIPMPSDSSASESSKTEESKAESSKTESSAAESSAAESSAEESSAPDADAYSETDNEEFAAFVNEQFINAL